MQSLSELTVSDHFSFNSEMVQHFFHGCNHAGRAAQTIFDLGWVLVFGQVFSMVAMETMAGNWTRGSFFSFLCNAYMIIIPNKSIDGHLYNQLLLLHYNWEKLINTGVDLNIRRQSWKKRASQS